MPRLMSAGSPDALVLGGGGILGEAWMCAVLSGLDAGGALDSRGCGLYIGTSAGSIVAASLVAGIAPDTRLGTLPEQPQDLPEESGAGALGGGLGLASGALGLASRAGSVAAAPLASTALGWAVPGGALLRRVALRRVPAGTRSLGGLGETVERAGASWDGRLRIAAVELRTGRRVLFGDPGAPKISVGQAVEASCSIPGVFRPVWVAGRSYVDGGVWSPTNMDAVHVEAGEKVLCLNPTGSLRPSRGALVGALGPLSRSIAAAEALTLRHRGAIVTTVNPDRVSSAALGTNLMDARRRSAVIEAGLVQGRRLAGRRLDAT
jgi:NTE family protein